MKSKKKKQLALAIREINSHVRERLSVKWNLIEDAPEGADFSPMLKVMEDPIFGPRLVENGFKVGTSSWVAVACRLLKKTPINIPGTTEPVNLMLFAVNNVGRYRRFIPAMKPYFVMVVGENTFWPCYNWNPISIDSPEEMDQYLTGWN